MDTDTDRDITMVMDTDKDTNMGHELSVYGIVDNQTGFKKSGNLLT
jgi:hypothetical protein